jgi:hypothetical protein
MSRAYAVSVGKGSVNYNNYVNSRITGPLNTSQTPPQIPTTTLGTLSGIRPTPPQFYPSQEPPNASMNVNARSYYLRTTTSAQKFKQDREIAVLSSNNASSHFSFSTGRRYANTGHTNYIAPISGGMYTSIRKKNAVGQSGFKVNLPDNAPITTKNVDYSYTRSQIKRVRSGGCVAPKKKGAPSNYSLANPGVCCWGSIPRQNY